MLLAAVLLTSCQGGAVVFAPTPLPPDLSPLRYTHPSGAFSVNVPRNWATFNQGTAQLASAAFSKPDSPQTALSVAVVNLGDPIAVSDLGDLMNEYQAVHRPDISSYREQTRQAMGDGSWRISGVRTLPNSQTQQLNTFIQASGTLLAVIEVVMPSDAVTQSELQTAVNTFQVDGTAATALQPSGLSALGFARATALDILNVRGWTTANGVFFVTGEIANQTTSAIVPMPVQVALVDSGGAVIDAANDVTMGYGISAGGFMPFSIRFGQGQPPNAVDYVVQIDTPEIIIPTLNFSGRDVLTWEDQSSFADDGDLVITATVTNTASYPVANPVAVITVFDEGGYVIGARFAELAEQQIAPGSAINIEVRLEELGGDPVNYIVEFQALGVGE